MFSSCSALSSSYFLFGSASHSTFTACLTITEFSLARHNRGLSLYSTWTNVTTSLLELKYYREGKTYFKL